MQSSRHFCIVSGLRSRLASSFCPALGQAALGVVLTVGFAAFPLAAQRSSRASTPASAASEGLPTAQRSQVAGQQSTDSGASDSQSGPGLPPSGVRTGATKAPALVDPTGPDVSLQSSEALFYIAAALNSCGYDRGLAASDPVRAKVREELNQALVGSAEARDAHDRLCSFFVLHRLSDPGLDLAQYISLALYTSPPPDLAPSAQNDEMPPDATQVEALLPLLRSFADLVDLHLIWLHSRPVYEQQLSLLHDSLTRMIVDTNTYLKLPVGTSQGGRRFLVVIEPMLDPGQTNARIYGADYVVVASPVHGILRMNEVRHTYLHYVIESLLYGRAAAMIRFQPFLKVVRDAPIDYADRNDVVALTVECMIRAIEARTMDTGVAIYKIPADITRSDLEAATRKHNASVQAAEAVRRGAVDHSVTQGYVMTAYFYNAFTLFERQAQSFPQSIGEMVYGMDVENQVNWAKHIQFAQQGSSELVQRAPAQPAQLDVAESKLTNGDVDGAQAIAEQALKESSADPGRADFILARVAILHRDIPAAQKDFSETIRLSKDPRLLAWSHIYLGRLYDVQDDRDHAVTEYQAALVVRDGQPDTKLAAEKGLKQPYEVPGQVHTSGGDDDQDSPAAAPGNSASGPAASPK